jgi:superfamily I DNA and/or RNA helicase
MDWLVDKVLFEMVDANYLQAIIDEAGFDQEWDVAITLSFSPRHVLFVGDHFQLQPICKFAISFLAESATVIHLFISWITAHRSLRLQ